MRNWRIRSRDERYRRANCLLDNDERRRRRLDRYGDQTFSEDMEDSRSLPVLIGGTLGTVFVSGVLDDGTIDDARRCRGTEKKDVLYAPGTAMDLAGNPLAAVASKTYRRSMMRACSAFGAHHRYTHDSDILKTGTATSTFPAALSVASSSIVSLGDFEGDMLTHAPAD